MLEPKLDRERLLSILCSELVQNIILALHVLK